MYGGASIGKSFFFERDPQAEIIDCTEMVNLISSLEDIEMALEYLEQRYQAFQSKKLPQGVLVFDNVNGLCASQGEDSAGASMVEQVKSERVTRWLLNKLEEQSFTMVIIARHFSLVNARLLDICCFDTLIELQPPTKQQRYEVIRDLIAPEAFQSQEVKLLAMAQLTEYFLAKDLFNLATDRVLLQSDDTFSQELFEQVVTAYKQAVFPESMQQAGGENVPDW